MVNFAQKDTMKSKERLMALLSGDPTDRVPFSPFSSGFSARIYGIDRGEFYRNPEKAFSAGINLMKAFPWMNSRPSYGWADRGAWEFGGKVRWPDKNRYPAPTCLEPVVTNPEDVDSIPDPDPKTAGMNPLVERFNTISCNHGFPASLPGGTPTTLSAGIVGRTNFLKWLIRYPGAVHRLQQKVTGFIIQTAKNTMKKYGAANCSVMCGVPMESNQLISSRTFEMFSKPYIQKILGYYVSEGVRNILVHLCGDHTANLIHWNDIPLPPRAVFSIGHEMDLKKTGQFIGKNHILAGNINNVILQTGSCQDVFEEVKRCLGIGMKHPGGFILMPACELPPDTPLENIEAVAKALYEYGYY
ncbi:MAG: hypothetical protein GXP56_00795 [Deltaproteobacteria bacterium]|nr:hypothetical protein [Deltaproteobacteria bacterium]